MRKLIAIAVATMASASAFAGVKAIVRGDYVNTPKFDNRSNTEVKGSSIFRGTSAKLDLDGKVGSATVTGRLDLGRTSQYSSGDALVEYIFISKEMMSGLSMHAGKLSNMTGGIENAMAGDADVYAASLANGGIAGNTASMVAQLSGTASIATPGIAPYSRGLGLTYMMGDHKFDAQVTNSSNHGEATATYKRHNMGIHWTGSFMDKMIQPVVGYTVGSLDTTTVGHEQTLINAGAKMKFGQVGVIAEYLANSDKDNTPTTGKTDSVTTMYALVDYTMDAWKPFAKIESSEFKNDDSASDASSFKRTAFNVGVELTPKSDEAFRYHLSYYSAADKYGTAGSKETVNFSQMLAGVKYSADLLK